MDGERFQRLVLKQSDDDDVVSPFEVTFDVVEDGEFHFAANDLASRFDLIDKYDNNRGWEWVRVERSQ